MNDLALIFNFRAAFEAVTFKAGICVEGRVLLVQEASDDGEFWVYGVSPGGMSAHGATPEAAYGAFRAFFGQILDDFAQESATAAEFRARVDAFVKEANNEDGARWEAARKARALAAASAGDFAKDLKVQQAGVPRVTECVDLTEPKKVHAIPMAAESEAENTEFAVAA